MEILLEVEEFRIGARRPTIDARVFGVPEIRVVADVLEVGVCADAGSTSFLVKDSEALPTVDLCACADWVAVSMRF